MSETDEQIIEALATKVMGWRRNADERFARYWIDSDGFETEPFQDYEVCIDCGTERYAWNPLTDPRACKQLRERMRELGCDYELEVSSVGYVNAYFRRYDSIALNELAGEWTGNDTEERAVAIAALRAMGVEV